jgi:outer membrane protein assembly factor BamB
MKEFKHHQRKKWQCALHAICWVVCCCAAATIRADEWPEFRGPTGQGLATASGLPLTWDQSSHVTWRRPIAGKGWSSPVVYQGQIYLTTSVPQSGDELGEQTLRTICLDARTGEPCWDVQVFLQPANEQSKIHIKNSFASPTPLIDGRRVYVHFGPNGTAALDLNGQLIWKTQEIQYDARHGGGGSPILSGRSLIFNCDGVERPFVVALDRDSGHEIWRTYRPEVEPERFSFATPLEIDVQGQRQVVSPGSSVVCSYTPDTGREIWRVRYPKKWSIIPRPVFAHGLVYVCTGYEGPAEILAIRPDGAGDVTDTHVVWRTKENVPHTPSPLIVGDKLFLLSDEGIASCRDAQTGKLHWRKRLSGNYSASPIYADGRVFFPSEDGECVVIAADVEFEELARNDLGEQTLASYAVGDGALFIRTAEHLYRIDAEPNSVP